MSSYDVIKSGRCDRCGRYSRSVKMISGKHQDKTSGSLPDASGPINAGSCIDPALSFSSFALAAAVSDQCIHRTEPEIRSHKTRDRDQTQKVADDQPSPDKRKRHESECSCNSADRLIFSADVLFKLERFNILLNRAETGDSDKFSDKSPKHDKTLLDNLCKLRILLNIIFSDKYIFDYPD